MEKMHGNTGKSTICNEISRLPTLEFKQMCRYSFPRVIVKSTMNLIAQKNRNIFHTSGGPNSKIKILTSHVPSETWRGECFLDSLWLWCLPAILDLQLHHYNLCLCCHMANFLFVSLFLCAVLFYKDTSHEVLQAHPTPV